MEARLGQAQLRLSGGVLFEVDTQRQHLSGLMTGGEAGPASWQAGNKPHTPGNLQQLTAVSADRPGMLGGLMLSVLNPASSRGLGLRKHAEVMGIGQGIPGGSLGGVIELKDAAALKAPGTSLRLHYREQDVQPTGEYRLGVYAASHQQGPWKPVEAALNARKNYLEVPRPPAMRWWALGASYQDRPAELLAFRLEKQAEQVALFWVSASEFNNPWFELQRSADLRNWQTLERVPGAGESRHLLSYQYLDASPFTYANHYRLRLINTDGKVFYSPVRSAWLREAPHSLQVRQEEGRVLRLVMPVWHKQRADLVLLDERGGQCFKLKLGLNLGRFHARWRLPALAAGTYYLSFRREGKEEIHLLRLE